jgi:alpha-beta hydrolase superfamily lysophospholipase
METLTRNAPDGTRLHIYRWLPEGAPVASMQIAHGMGEHAARYDSTARALTAAGYAVYAKDHRGHGRAADPARLGYMGPDGWNGTIRDAAALSEIVRAEHPGVPHALLGHSMGAMLAQQFVYRHGALIDALALSGSPGVAGRVQSWLSSGLARLERWRRGADQDSPLMQSLLFGKSNAAFDAPGATGYEWLSRDGAQVQAYVDDARCGFVLRNGSLCELFAGAREARRRDNALQIRRALPIYIFSGSDDPVHRGERNLARLRKLYEGHVLRVDYRIYPGGRHEMLNETNRDEVVQDLLGWLAGALPVPKSTLESAARSPN